MCKHGGRGDVIYVMWKPGIMTRYMAFIGNSSDILISSLFINNMIFGKSNTQVFCEEDIYLGPSNSLHTVSYRNKMKQFFPSAQHF